MKKQQTIISQTDWFKTPVTAVKAACPLYTFSSKPTRLCSFSRVEWTNKSFFPHIFSNSSLTQISSLSEPSGPGLGATGPMYLILEVSQELRVAGLCSHAMSVRCDRVVYRHVFVRAMQSLYPQAVKSLSPTPPSQHSLEHSSAGGMGHIQRSWPPVMPPNQLIRSEADYAFQQPDQFATSGTNANEPSQFGNMKTGTSQQVGYGRLNNNQSVFGPSGISGPDPLNPMQQPVQEFPSLLSGPGMEPVVDQGCGDWSKPPSSQQFGSKSVQVILSRPFSCTSLRECEKQREMTNNALVSTHTLSVDVY